MKPRVAFCFHDSEPSGASLWLQKFLTGNPLPEKKTYAILPGPSPMEEELKAARVLFTRVNITQSSLSQAGMLKGARLLKNRIGAVWKYREKFKRHKIQLVYVNSSVQIAPMIAATSLGLPFIVHVREGWISGRTFPLKKWILRRYASAALFDARQAMELFGGKPKADSLWFPSPNGVAEDLEKWKDGRAKIRKELKVPESQKLFLFLGTICHRKGVPELLNVWRKFHRAHPESLLLLAGGVKLEKSSRVVDELQLGKIEGARYLGYRKDALALLGAADALVLPSYGEAMPIVISEALMMGIPVIARDVADVGWQVGNGRGILIKKAGDRALRSAMEKFQRLSPEQVSAMVERGQHFARENLSTTSQIEQIRGVIDQLLISPR